ncbi:hypothetical protein [Rhodococcus sp. UNC363MFTsu5.1]|nr:hypothetical protein [Rhodococcus sp. UNC363MFTsu5.1]
MSDEGRDRRTLGCWAREDEEWEPIHEALGGTNDEGSAAGLNFRGER